MPLGRPRNHGCRISDQWTLQGMRALVLENELLRVVVLVDKGSDIIEFRYKPLDLDFLLLDPRGVRSPARSQPSLYSQSPFIDYYSGGWNEVLPSGGPTTSYKGAEFGQHGEISLLSWEYALLEDAPEGVAVKLWVRSLRTPFFVEKTLAMKPGLPALFVDETVTNEAGEPMHLMWGQHIAFGREFLAQGARLDIPARRFLVNEPMPDYEPRRFQPGAASAWPLAPTPGGGQDDASRIPALGETQAQEMAYITELEAGWYALSSAALGVGFGLSFDPGLYPYVWYWQQLGDVAGSYPWWKRIHTTALEPWTSYPTGGLAESVRNGTARLLQPGEQLHSHLAAVAFVPGGGRVTGVTPEGQVLHAPG